ncbi:hypothetical protein CF326_g701 [Tilletia indica]|nr:hypothetical protein CF326_g701 [Tilletia indica]
MEEVLTSVVSLPVALSLFARFTPAAISGSFYYTQLHRLQSALTFFVHLLLATSNLSLEHALYLKLSMKPKEHERKVHPLVIVTSVPRGALKVQQTVLAASLLALGSQYWLSYQPNSGIAQLARTLLAHASLIISAAMTMLSLPLDGPSLQVMYTLTGLESIYSQGYETGTQTSEEQLSFAPIDIILPSLPARTADGKVLPMPDQKSSSTQGQDEPDAEGWLKVAATNKKRDVYVRKTAGGRGRGWELKTELAADHPMKEKAA